MLSESFAGYIPFSGGETTGQVVLRQSIFAHPAWLLAMASHPSFSAHLGLNLVSSLIIFVMATADLLALSLLAMRFLRNRRACREGGAVRILERAPQMSTRGRTLRMATCAVFIMCIFEVLHMFAVPSIHIRVSHWVSILFTTLMVGMITFVILWSEDRLLSEIDSAEERYRLLFESSFSGAYQASLARASRSWRTLHDE